MARSAIINVMVQAAFKAGRSLARDFGEVQNLQVSLKGPGDYVSQADRRAEEIVHAELSKARPGYAFLMEERGVIEGDDDQHRWLVDPLDGTTNFLHGIPLFAVSIALERQGQLAAAVVFNPAMDELYTAERGGGAFMNDRRLRVASRSKLADTVIGTGIPHLGRGHHGNALIELRNVMGEVSGVRRMGAAALDLAYVAAGRLDGFWEHGLSPWDMGAGALLIREAGGFVTDYDGGADFLDTGSIVAGNEAIHRALLKQLKKPLTKA
ncbi:inositol monophosphatase [Nitratireductor mangrovi]|uniref:Inositol-1-monophosphatase n=1 Tax=Nitratireductor mangrovi TaxID=2599600 RepID=A0A5B8KWP9_9HYPH|nr:inositol monophosphatase family protein [Nitratireductor mangrovi]QDY99981.1 inositol monophosphatase [Nitratireductor mangrovi]